MRYAAYKGILGPLGHMLVTKTLTSPIKSSPKGDTDTWMTICTKSKFTIGVENTIFITTSLIIN